MAEMVGERGREHTVEGCIVDMVGEREGGVYGRDGGGERGRGVRQRWWGRESSRGVYGRDGRKEGWKGVWQRWWGRGREQWRGEWQG